MYIPKGTKAFTFPGLIETGSGQIPITSTVTGLCDFQYDGSPEDGQDWSKHVGTLTLFYCISLYRVCVDVIIMYNSEGTRSKCTAKLLHNELRMQEFAVELQTPIRNCLARNEENTNLPVTTVDVSKCGRRKHSVCAKSTAMIQLKARRRV